MGRYSPGYRLYLIASWNLFIVLIGYGTYLSLVPAPGAAFENVWDKLLHLSGWFVLTLALRVAWPRPRMPWWTIFSLLVYSLIIELLQEAVPNRQFELWDLVSNGIGILLAYSLSLLVWPHIERKQMARLR